METVALCREVTSYVMLWFVVIVDVLGVVVGLLLIILSRVESRGCYMYRGDAAQIFIEQYWLSLEIVSLMNSNWSM